MKKSNAESEKNVVNSCDLILDFSNQYKQIVKITATLLFLCIALLMQLSFAKAEAYQVTLILENDALSFNDKDRYYTDGLKLSMTLPNLFEISIGQQIFTPNDKKSFLENENDRPYAGYLYASLSKHFLNESTANTRLRTAELTLGVTGPSALAEEAQNSIHSILGANKANGWDYQVKDEFMAMLTFAQTTSMNANGIRAKQGGWNWDLLPRAALSLGTPYTMLGLGGEARYGWNLPVSFYTPVIRPANGLRLQDPEGFSVYFFAGLEGQAVLWNTFLDGNISGKRSPSVDKYPFVANLLGGIAMSYNNFTIAYTQTLRTKEFKGQDGTHLYGSFSMTYNF